MAVSPTSDYVFVTNRLADGTVSVINPTTNTVTATIPVGSSPYGVAIDPVTGAVYVANFQSGTVSVISA
ncbi:YncE family protein [Mycobacterium kiyosense]